ncbi:hypothetical protein ACHWQZ_G014531 [Mnemiopsis leidyi]
MWHWHILLALNVFILKLSRTGAEFYLVDQEGQVILEEEQGLLLYDGGTVCDGKVFGPTEVYAICREMGFDSVEGWLEGLQWPSVQTKYPISLADVNCTGPYWSSCTVTALVDPHVSNCTHHKDVLITCKGSVISCPAGWFRSYRICRQCPLNTYKTSVGTQTEKSCLLCPGSSSAIPGSSSCSCPAGMFWNETDCLNCPDQSVSQSSASVCTQCPAGSEATPDRTACNCTAGMTWRWDSKTTGSCQPCSPGTYKNLLTKTCDVCPPGTTSMAGSEQCICRAGTYWTNKTCQICPIGTASPPGSIECQNCSHGTFTDKNSGNLSVKCACPWGKRWDWNIGEKTQGYCLFDSSFVTGALSSISVILSVICLVLVCSLVSVWRQLQGGGRLPVPRTNSGYGGFAFGNSDQETLL